MTNYHIHLWGLSFLLFFPFFLGAQPGDSLLKGKVTEADQSTPLVGANVYWLGATRGAVTDTAGFFQIPRVATTNQLIISFIGFENDTVEVEHASFATFSLGNSLSLEEVEVVHRRKSSSISFIEPMKVEQISEQELLKAACCNLSESFETSPSVDVSFTDAITGTRQIQLLGLAGPYTQITRENIPSVRGLASMYGLTYTPGPWVESMQLNKGTGSVVNGYESMAGQINVELRKPETADRLYLNLYANEMGRLEANANLAHRFEHSNWSTALLLHGKRNAIKQDRNEDGFLDNPLSDQFIAVNRWKLIDPKGIMFQAGIKGTFIENTGGQTAFSPSDDPFSANFWGMQLNTQRLDGWMKLGKVYLEQPWKSFGFQLAGVHHRQDSYFGRRSYDATQQGIYANFVYQSMIGNTNHKFKTGASLQYDQYEEALDERNFDRTETVPGAFFEYAYTLLDRFSALAGLRIDHHSIFGTFVTPRAHLRYAPAENTVLRASAGRGQRTANILAENNGLLASARQFRILGDGSNKPYGLDQEVAWNYGLNFTQGFRLDYREGTVSFDFYRTDFVNQVVIDLDQDPQQVVFYNLDGQSFSNSFQAQVDYELIKRLDIRLAYRWLDVRTTYGDRLLEKPLVASHRAFMNLAYSTRSHWSFDYTFNWQGTKRVPFTGSNPEIYQLPERSPDFVVMHVQISKTWKEKLEFYLGAENLLDFRQKDPILSSEQPFGSYFDSSLIWGPVFGRNVYVGMRYKVK